VRIKTSTPQRAASSFYSTSADLAVARFLIQTIIQNHLRLKAAAGSLVEPASRKSNRVPAA